MKVKFFTTSTWRGPIWAKHDPVAALEQAVNGWLTENPAVRVVTVHQSATGGSMNHATLLISVWYEPDAEPVAAVDPPRAAGH